MIVHIILKPSNLHIQNKPWYKHVIQTYINFHQMIIYYSLTYSKQYKPQSKLQIQDKSKQFNAMFNSMQPPWLCNS